MAFTRIKFHPPEISGQEQLDDIFAHFEAMNRIRFFMGT